MERSNGWDQSWWLKFVDSRRIHGQRWVWRLRNLLVLPLRIYVGSKPSLAVHTKMSVSRLRHVWVIPRGRIGLLRKIIRGAFSQVSFSFDEIFTKTDLHGGCWWKIRTWENMVALFFDLKYINFYGKWYVNIHIRFFFSPNSKYPCINI